MSDQETDRVDSSVEAESEGEERNDEDAEVSADAVPEATPEPVAASEATHSVAARETLRQQLANDVEEFLKRGGEIQDVPINVRADPPKKPENNYGRGSL